MTEVLCPPKGTPFGRLWREAWMLDPRVRYLNHGTVGATPRRVLARQQALRDQMERGPSQFLLREVVPLTGVISDAPGLLRTAMDAVAVFVGAQPQDVGFVSNVTAGLNAVLHSLRFERGDQVLMLDQHYGAIGNAVRAIAGKQGAELVFVRVPMPLTSTTQVVDAVAEAITPRTRLAILDHITASSAVVLPIQQMVAACHARGVPVAIDGAHAPGAIDLDVSAIGADWYAANLHKWAYAPRSCGFLHVKRDRQPTLHAPIISWGYDNGLDREFDWQGTSDPTPMLCAPEGIAMLRDIGPLLAHNHSWAWRAVKQLESRVGAERLAPESMVGSMAAVALPKRFGSGHHAAMVLRDALLFQHNIEVQVGAGLGVLSDRVLLRVCGQAYTDDDDIAALCGALAAEVDTPAAHRSTA